jgi:post-segregation antitoxin (ccd killing protein)
MERNSSFMVDEKTTTAIRTLKARAVNVSALIRAYLQKEAANYGK